MCPDSISAESDHHILLFYVGGVPKIIIAVCFGISFVLVAQDSVTVFAVVLSWFGARAALLLVWCLVCVFFVCRFQPHTVQGEIG